MSNTSGGLKLKEVLTPELRERVMANRKTSEKAQDSKFTKISENAFFKIVFDPNSDPDTHQSQIAALLEYTTKAEFEQKMAALQEFIEFLHDQKTQMAEKVMRIQNTDTFALIQSTYKDIGGSLINFEDDMKPLTDIIEALYDLRTNGVTFDAFKEIQEEKKIEEKINADLASIDTDINYLKSDITTIEQNIAALSEEKSLFGFGGIKQEARQKIAALELEMDNKLAEIENKAKKKSEVAASLHATKANDQFGAQKEKLRELLDLTSDEHRQRVKNLVDSALQFVEVNRNRIGEVRGQLGDLGGQIGQLRSGNNKMLNIFATISEGVKDAREKNVSKREGLIEPGGTESLVAKMKRDESRVDIETAIKKLDDVAIDSTTSFSDLASQGIRIKSMEDSTEEQSNKIRTMHTQGVSGIADRLATVLTAVSSAAISESSGAAQDALLRMRELTNNIAQKESIKNAMSIDEQNADMVRALDDLMSFGEVMKTATEITKKGVAELHENMAKIQEVAASTVEDLQKSYAVNAETGIDTDKKDQKTTDKGAFGF